MTTLHYSIPAGMLRAALMHAGKRDVRYYLNGVHVDAARGCIVATDGHRLFVGRMPEFTRPVGPAPEGFIIPRAELEMALKVHKATHGRKADAEPLTIERTGDALRLGPTVTATRVDGQFPEVTRVIPREVSGVFAGLNADYVTDARDALHATCDCKPSAWTAPSIAYNGEGPAVVTLAACPDAFVVIMPCRDRVQSPAETVATIAHVLRSAESAPVAAEDAA